MMDYDIGIDNGVVVIGASKSSRERIVNTMGIIRRHLNNIKNTNHDDTEVFVECDGSDSGVVEHNSPSTWRVSPMKPLTPPRLPLSPRSPFVSLPLLRSFSTEYSPYERRPRRPPPPTASRASRDLATPPPSTKSTTSTFDTFPGSGFSTPLTPPVTPPSKTVLQHSQRHHSSVLNNPLDSPQERVANSSSSMDVDVIGLSLLVEDISCIMDRMTLYVDPHCGNLLRFSSDQPPLGASLLTLASSSAQGPSSPGTDKCGSQLNNAKLGSGGATRSDPRPQTNLSVVCQSFSRISSLLSACQAEDKRLGALVSRGEVDGVLCLQTDVEELLHSSTVRAAIAARLPIVAVGLASAQQLLQMGGRVIACYDLSLAPLASSAQSLSPFLPPAARRHQHQRPSPSRHIVSASYNYFLAAEQLCDESLGYYVAASFAAHWREHKAYSIPLPRRSLILDNIVRRTLLLLGFIGVFHWLLQCTARALHLHTVAEEGGPRNISLLVMLSPTSVISQPYMYFAMLVFSYTCLHFAYPAEDYTALPELPQPALLSQSPLRRVLSWQLQFILYKHSRKYVFRLAVTACMFVYLVRFSPLASLLLPLHPSRDDPPPGGGSSTTHVHVCSRYALTLAFCLGALCGTLQHFINLILRKITRKSFRGACDVTSIALSFLATGTLAMLVIRSFRINLYESLMMSTTSLNSRNGSSSSYSSGGACLHEEGVMTCSLAPRHVQWLVLFEHSAFWFLPPAFSRLLVTVAVATAHLLHVCVAQALDMLSVGAAQTAVAAAADRGGSGDTCLLGSFFWKIATDRVGVQDSFPAPRVLVSLTLAVFSGLVSCCAGLYIENKAFFMLLVPALLLDLDHLTSPVTLPEDWQDQPFHRTRAVCSLYLPYAGVISAIALRSVARTESLFMYYEYLGLFVAAATSPSSTASSEAASAQKNTWPPLLFAVFGHLSAGGAALVTTGKRLFVQSVRACTAGGEARHEDIVLDLGCAATSAKYPPAARSSSQNDHDDHDDIDEEEEEEEDKEEAAAGRSTSQRSYCPALVLRVLRDSLCSPDSQARVARMLYDWTHMRDCLLELQLCSQHHRPYFLVKLVCLRILPCLVAARLLLRGGTDRGCPGSDDNGVCDPVCEYFALLLRGIGAADEQSCVAGESPAALRVLGTLFNTLVGPGGSFVSACLFTMMALCLPS